MPLRPIVAPTTPAGPHRTPPLGAEERARVIGTINAIDALFVGLKSEGYHQLRPLREEQRRLRDVLDGFNVDRRTAPAMVDQKLWLQLSGLADKAEPFLAFHLKQFLAQLKAPEGIAAATVRNVTSDERVAALRIVEMLEKYETQGTSSPHAVFHVADADAPTLRAEIERLRGLSALGAQVPVGGPPIGRLSAEVQSTLQAAYDRIPNKYGTPSMERWSNQIFNDLHWLGRFAVEPAQLVRAAAAPTPAQSVEQRTALQTFAAREPLAEKRSPAQAFFGK